MKKSLMMISLLAIAVLPIAAQDRDIKRYGGGNPQRQALEGKPALPLTGGEWFNTEGKKLQLKAMNGKVVVLDFWAHW
jgi:hypothetical protein